MKIDISRHARRRMKWRDINEDEFTDTVLHPEKIEDSINDRKNAFKHVGEKYLKVTFAREGDKIIVVTVIDRNR